MDDKLIEKARELASAVISCDGTASAAINRNRLAQEIIALLPPATRTRGQEIAEKMVTDGSELDVIRICHPASKFRFIDTRHADAKASRGYIREYIAAAIDSRDDA